MAAWVLFVLQLMQLTYDPESGSHRKLNYVHSIQPSTPVAVLVLGKDMQLDRAIIRRTQGVNMAEGS